MKRLILFVFVLILSILAACGTSATPAKNASASNAASVSPSSEKSASPTSSVTDSVAAFQKDPQKFFADALSSLQGMADLIDNSSLISIKNSEAFSTFWFSNYTPDSNQGKIKADIPYYDFSIPADDATWSLDVISKKVSDSLKLKYEDKDATDPSGDTYIYKDAKGNATGYSDSRIYFDCNDFVMPNTARILFSYTNQNEVIHSLVQDSFSRNIISIPEALGKYKETYGIEYDFDQYIGETTKKVGCVTKRWWNLSKDDAGNFDKLITKAGFTDTDPSDGFQTYYIKLNDGYFGGAEAELDNMGTDSNPYYVVGISIYYKAK